MKQNALHIVFISIIIAVSIFFSVASIFVSGSDDGREQLLSAPTVKLSDGGFNKNYTGDLAEYFADHFAFRQNLIDYYSKLSTSLLSSSPVSKVIYGKDGWLFFSETLDDYLKTSPLTQRELFAAARSLSLMQEYAEGCGAQFLFVPVPNKNSLYGEFMPYEGMPGASNLDALILEMSSQDVNYLDLRESFSKRPATLYFKTDTHWNSLGAAIAADAIIDRFGFTSGFETRMTASSSTDAGDLYEMLFPASNMQAPDYEYAPGFTFEYTSPFRSAEDMSISTKGPGEDRSLLMFRDSFGNSLYSFMAQFYSEALFSRSNTYRMDLIAQQQADSVVIELVERNLDYLLRYAPIFPAPERQVTQNMQTSGLEGRLWIDEQSPLQDCVRVYGSIAADTIDFDSLIYLTAGGRIFEATPSGGDNGGNNFTAYLPRELSGSTFSAFVCIDGVLMEISLNNA